MKRIIAVNSNCYHGFSIEDAIDGIAKAGFKYIELTATKGWTEHVFADMTFEYLLSLKEKLKKAELTPFAMSGHCNLMDKERIYDFVKNIKLASFFGCDYIVSSIGEAHLEDKHVLDNKSIALQIKGLIGILEEYNMTLVLETHGDHGTGAIIKEIIELINSKRILINYDTANVIFYGDVDLEKDISCCIDKIGFVHLKDKAGEKKEWNFPTLGNGQIDFPMIFNVFSEKKNDSPFSIEIEFTEKGPSNLEEVNKAIADSFAYLKLNEQI